MWDDSTPELVSKPVTKPPGKKHCVVRWIDPATNAVRQRSTGKTCRREAQSLADQIAGEVFTDRAEKEITWNRFCERYELERLSSCKPNTAKT